MATCDRTDTTKCIFPDYTSTDTECRFDSNENPAYDKAGLAAYNDDEFKGWLKGLYDRDAGKDKTKSEKQAVINYVSRCNYPIAGVEVPVAPTPAEPPVSKAKADSGMSGGAIAGIVVLVLFVIAVIIIAIVLKLRRRLRPVSLRL